MSAPITHRTSYGNAACTTIGSTTEVWFATISSPRPVGRGAGTSPLTASRCTIREYPSITRRNRPRAGSQSSESINRAAATAAVQSSHTPPSTRTPDIDITPILPGFKTCSKPAVSGYHTRPISHPCTDDHKYYFLSQTIIPYFILKSIKGEQK